MYGFSPCRWWGVFFWWNADETGLLAESAGGGDYFKTHRHIDFLDRVYFELDCVGRVAQRRCTLFGTRMKRVRLGGALVVADFLLPFAFECLRQRLE